MLTRCRVGLLALMLGAMYPLGAAAVLPHQIPSNEQVADDLLVLTSHIEKARGIYHRQISIFEDLQLIPEVADSILMNQIPPGDVSDAVFSVLDSARAELNEIDLQLKKGALPTPRVTNAEAVAQMETLTAMLETNVATLKRYADLSELAFAHAVSGDYQAYDSAFIQLLQMSATMVDAETIWMKSSLVLMEPTHPQYGITRGMIYANEVTSILTTLSASLVSGQGLANAKLFLDEAASNLEAIEPALSMADAAAVRMANVGRTPPGSKMERRAGEILLDLGNSYLASSQIERQIATNLRGAIEALKTSFNLAVSEEEAERSLNRYDTYFTIIQSLVNDRLVYQEQRLQLTRRLSEALRN